ncbi:hypothetical protein NEOKW01_1650 [Nematocida sp. AWRm80]|nr:hypothetical protein NEOKW01_1650 [Nematocida sp. AWRm80]
MELELYLAYRHDNLEESTLLLIEYIFQRTPSPSVFYLLVKTLLLNNNYEAIKWIVNKKKEYYEYEGVKKIYVEALKRLGLLSEIEPVTIAIEKQIEEIDQTEYTPIHPRSTALYYQVLTQKSSKDKLLMIQEALEIDERNLELLIYMSNNYNEEHLRAFVNKVEDSELQYIYNEILFKNTEHFNIFFKDFISPYTCCKIGKSLFNMRRTNELFQLAQHMVMLYPKNSTTYMVAGMYYLLAKKYSDAKRSLFKSLQINNSSGVCWLLLGHCLGLLCECINAIGAYEKAEMFLEENYMASLGVALEHHGMRNYSRAEEKYLEIKNEYGLDKCFNPYIALLVSQERYDEALMLLEDQREPLRPETLLLKSFCQLFQKSQECKGNTTTNKLPFIDQRDITSETRSEEGVSTLINASTRERPVFGSAEYQMPSKPVIQFPSSTNCHLALSHLKNIDVSCSPKLRSKYYLLKGYIYHILKEYCNAIEFYQLAILDPLKPLGGLINDLLELAMKNSLEDDNKQLVVQYIDDIFDFLDLQSNVSLKI